MYCKHCGSQITDDSVFCAKCGKLVIEATPESFSKTSSTQNFIEPQWWKTDNMQWIKPTTARIVQICILIILGLLSLYPLWCFLSGGDVSEYGHNYIYQKHECHVKNPLHLEILKFTDVSMQNHITYREDYKSTFTVNDARNLFRGKVFLVLLPFILLIWLTIRWMKSTRFPGEKDIVPRDVADEIEQYEWYGFTKYKYIFYKKDGKYGIIDARNYCVSVPAQYDSIAWRLPNKTYDVTLAGGMQTFTINKTPHGNPIPKAEKDCTSS